MVGIQGPVDGIYLSGWEYNRLLQADPLSKRNSALPAELLWNGGAQLWLYKHVYVTAEAIDNERYASEALGWPTGSIFNDLVAAEIVVPVDWRRDLKPSTKRNLKETHLAIREKYPEKTVLDLIGHGHDAELEAIKQELLRPILDDLSCLTSISPNSLKNWTRPVERQNNDDIHKIIEVLAAPVRAGLELIRPPGSGVSETARGKQRTVQETIEAPMIPDLLAGTGPFAWSAGGHVPYIDALRPYRDAYGPINEQIAGDWAVNRDRLLELRAIAERHLWPSLHGEWLPRLLESRGAYSGEFLQMVGDAIQLDRFATRLRKPVTWGFAIVGGAATLATLTGVAPIEPFLKSLAELSTSSGHTISTVAAAFGAAFPDNALDVPGRLSRSMPLAMFYQKASAK